MFRTKKIKQWGKEPSSLCTRINGHYSFVTISQVFDEELNFRKIFIAKFCFLTLLYQNKSKVFVLNSRIVSSPKSHLLVKNVFFRLLSISSTWCSIKPLSTVVKPLRALTSLSKKHCKASKAKTVCYWRALWFRWYICRSRNFSCTFSCSLSCGFSYSLRRSNLNALTIPFFIATFAFALRLLTFRVHFSI